MRLIALLTKSMHLGKVSGHQAVWRWVLRTPNEGGRRQGDKHAARLQTDVSTQARPINLIIIELTHTDFAATNKYIWREDALGRDAGELNSSSVVAEDVSDNADQMPCRLLPTPEALEGFGERAGGVVYAGSLLCMSENSPRGQGKPAERVPVCAAPTNFKETSVSKRFPLRDSLMHFLLGKVFFSALGNLISFRMKNDERGNWT